MRESIPSIGVIQLNECFLNAEQLRQEHGWRGGGHMRYLFS